jgi:hypothetical protein
LTAISDIRFPQPDASNVGKFSGESRAAAISQNFFVWRAATTPFYGEASQEKE